MFASVLFPNVVFPADVFPHGAGLVPAVSTFRRSLVAAIKGSSAVTSIVGAKVFAIKVPETQIGPWVLYHVSAINRVHTLSGYSGMSVASAQIGCGSKDQTQCEALSEAVRALLDGYIGSLGGAGGVTILETLSASEKDLYDPPVDASDAGVFWTVLAYTFKYRETVLSH